MSTPAPRRSRTSPARTPRAHRQAEGGGVRRTLITGASAGIGAELARECARHGHPLTLVARRRKLLAALAAELRREYGVEVELIVQDLARPDGPAAVMRALQQRGRAIDILINNAGVAQAGPFVDADPARLVGLLDLNVRALTELTRRLLPGMIERGFGRVLNVASLAAFQPVPLLATYAAGKAYVLSLTEALSEELRGSGVTVTALCPGLTDTNMVNQIRGEWAPRRTLPGALVSDPREVAAQAYLALMAAQTVLVPGLPNQLSAAWAQATPRPLRRFLLGLAARQVDRWARSG